MHPEILRELTAQRSRDLQAQAHQARLARIARAGRRGHGVPDRAGEPAVAAIPDYVDGSFGTGPARETAASEPGQAPAARHAA